MLGTVFFGFQFYVVFSNLLVKLQAERAVETVGGVGLVAEHLVAFYWKLLEPSSPQVGETRGLSSLICYSQPKFPGTRPKC